MSAKIIFYSDIPINYISFFDGRDLFRMLEFFRYFQIGFDVFINVKNSIINPPMVGISDNCVYIYRIIYYKSIF